MTQYGYDANGNATRLSDTSSSQSAVQLLQNPGFENGMYAWATGGSASSLNSTVVHSGVYSVQIPNSGSQGTGAGVSQTNTLPTVTRSGSLSFWYKGSCTASCGSMVVNLVDPTSGITEQTASFPETASMPWTQETLNLGSWILTEGGNSLKVFFVGQGTGTDYTYVDDTALTINKSDLLNTTYTFNSLDQETQKTLPNGHQLTYAYDGADNLLSKTDGGGQTSFTYNPDDQVATVTDPQSNQSTYGYDADGNLKTIAYPNGVAQTLAWNADGNLTSIVGKNAAGSVLTSYTYTYTDPNQSNIPTTRRYSMTDASGNVTTYGYDSLNRLTNALQKDPSGVNTLASYAYAYDPVNNLASKTVNGAQTSFTYNAADQLTAAGTTTFSYNGAGDLLSKTGGPALTYNAAGQTNSIGGAAQSYTGAGQGERTAGGTTNYEYDAGDISASTASGSTTYYTRTPDSGGLVSERIPNGSGGYNAYYYLFDGLGSVVGLADASGNLVNTYAYDPYGNPTSATGTVANPFRYVGAAWDSSTGLYKMGERYYDPSVGRFTQVDPFDGQTYAYTVGDPINFVDPSGMDEAPPIAHEGGAPAEGSGGEGEAPAEGSGDEGAGSAERGNSVKESKRAARQRLKDGKMTKDERRQRAKNNTKEKRPEKRQRSRGHKVNKSKSSEDRHTEPRAGDRERKDDNMPY